MQYQEETNEFLGVIYAKCIFLQKYLWQLVTLVDFLSMKSKLYEIYIFIDNASFDLCWVEGI